MDPNTRNRSQQRAQLSATPSRRGFGKGPYRTSIIDPFGKWAATLSRAAASNLEVPGQDLFRKGFAGD